MKQEFSLDSPEVLVAAKQLIVKTLMDLCYDSERYISASELAQKISQPHLRNSEPYRTFNEKYGTLASPPSNVELVVKRLHEEGKLVRIKLGKNVGYRLKNN
ncbi:MAG: hypothetical protein AABY16_04000 [Nanoarchaeota archaeon]